MVIILVAIVIIIVIAIIIIIVIVRVIVIVIVMGSKLSRAVGLRIYSFLCLNSGRMITGTVHPNMRASAPKAAQIV